jgi:hypothetical protein
VNEAGDILRLVASCLALAGAFSGLVAVSDAPAGKKLPWKARFVAAHKRHPRAHSLSLAFPIMGLICLIVSVPLTFGWV